MDGDGASETVGSLNTKYLPLLSLYAIGLGVLYQWGYWIPFRVDILEYMALSDVFKAAALPLLFVSASLSIGVFANYLQSRRDSAAPAEDEVDLSWEALRRRKRKLRALMTAVVIVWLVLTVLAFQSGFFARWTMASVFLAMPVAVIADRRKVLDDLLPDSTSRGLMTIGLATLPVLAFGSGWDNAQAVVSGRAFEYVSVVADGDGIPDSATILRRPRFVGHAGDVEFLWNPHNSALTLTKLDAKNSLVLLHYNARLTLIEHIFRANVAPASSAAVASAGQSPASVARVRSDSVSAPRASASAIR
jgi:hypothetical protein